jgi:hypothetical protein
MRTIHDLEQTEEYLLAYRSIGDRVKPCVTFVLKSESRDGAIITLELTNNPRTFNCHHASFAALHHKRIEIGPELLSDLRLLS